MSAVPYRRCRRSGKEMMNVKARWARCGAGLAALALVAAACGGGTDNDEAADEVVTQATVAATEAPPTITPPTTAAALPTDAMELLRVAFENSATRSVRGEIQMDMGELLSMSAQFESDGNQSFSMVMGFDQVMDAEDLAGFGLEMRAVEGTAYVRFVIPDEMRDLLGDAMPKGWFTLDAASAAEMGIVCPAALPGTTPDDGLCPLPNDHLYLIEHVRSAEIVDQTDIDGVSAVQVRVTLDFAAAFAEHIAEAEGGDDSMPFAGDMFPGEVVYDVWIDGDGLTRRMSLDLGPLMEDLVAGLDEAETEGFEEELAGLFDITNVINYYDYDADITIEAPPADQIIGDFGDIMGPDFGEASAFAPGYENS